MNKYILYLNSRRCIGCHGCEVHCKVNKNLRVGPILCEVRYEPLKLIRGIPKTVFSFRSCYHCEDPLCERICPTSAMIKRDDGIVSIDSDKCIGCMARAKACPWRVPQHNPLTGKAEKCDYCMDRVDAGLKPACVAKCSTRALKFIVMQEF